VNTRRTTNDFRFRFDRPGFQDLLRVGIRPLEAWASTPGDERSCPPL